MTGTLANFAMPPKQQYMDKLLKKEVPWAEIHQALLSQFSIYTIRAFHWKISNQR
jgi:hypothetical protein